MDYDYCRPIRPQMERNETRRKDGTPLEELAQVMVIKTAAHGTVTTCDEVEFIKDGELVAAMRYDPDGIGKIPGGTRIWIEVPPDVEMRPVDFPYRKEPRRESTTEA